MDFEGNPTEVYVVTITGPSELYSGMKSTEKFYFSDGIGALGRSFFEETSNPYLLYHISTMPDDAPDILPSGTRVFSHNAWCIELNKGKTQAIILS